MTFSLFTNCFAQYLGKISFAVYIVHGPILHPIWTSGNDSFMEIHWPREDCLKLPWLPYRSSSCSAHSVLSSRHILETGGRSLYEILGMGGRYSLGRFSWRLN